MKTVLTFILSSLLSMGLLVASQSVFADNLTDKQVTQWMKAWPQLQTWGEKHEKEFEQFDKTLNDGDSAKVGEWFTNIASTLKASGHYDEYGSILKKNGFSSVEEWAGISNRIVDAVVSASIKQQNPAMMAQMKASMEQLNAANLPPEQKQMMMQMMQQSQAMFKTIDDVPPADVSLISKHLPALTQLLETEE